MGRHSLQSFPAPMKIKLASTLPFTPVQLDAHSLLPRRAVGQLNGIERGREYLLPVYKYEYRTDDVVQYLVDPAERVFIDQQHDLSAQAANDGDLQSDLELEWVEHDETQSYKPYAFLVMNAMTRLVGDWDGVVYRTPSGERLSESAWHATLQVVDTCVCVRTGLWAMVQLQTDTDRAESVDGLDELYQTGWVRL